MILFKTDYNGHIVGGGKSPSLSNPGEYVTFFLQEHKSCSRNKDSRPKKETNVTLKKQYFCTDVELQDSVSHDSKLN